jgi:glycosyltransferase involved in cell wall biosynthesis
MRILFISRWFPFPANNGSKIRIWNLLKQLSRGYDIHLVAFADAGEADDESMAHLRSLCQDITIVPKPHYYPNRFKALLGYLSPLPRSVVGRDSAPMRRTLADLVASDKHDIVLVSQIETAAYAVPNTTGLKLLDEVELAAYVDTLKAQHTTIRHLRFWLTAIKHYRYVAGIVRQFDTCTTVSERERCELLRLVPNHASVEIVPNGVDVQAYRGDFGEPAPATLVYCGALTFFANFDAMSYFLHEVYPLILSKVAQTKLLITGKTDGVSLHQLPLGGALQRGSVDFTGYLDDIRPTVARSWISIVPLRVGGGTRVKILESLALGTPVVATTKGAEGLDLVPGRDILLADTPSDFAAAVLTVFQDVELRDSLSRNGRHAVAAKYDWEIIGRTLRNLVDSRVAAKRGAA